MSDRTQYFKKFPLTIYNDVPAINILRRVDFNTKVRDFFTAFYSFTVKSGERLETVAFDYYDDQDLDWLIYHTNDIMDPYHDVVLDFEDFEETIKKKYGSIRLAKLKTFCYRNNYRGDIQMLTSDGYSALDGDVKKYWKPQFALGQISGYDRNEDDMFASTNRIISFSFSATVENTFTKNEIVTNNKGGMAQVATSNTSYVTLQHIEGDWASYTTNFDVTGDESGRVINFDHATYKLIQHVIPEAEAIYFEKYSFYDYETEKNDALRNISLIDKAYAEEINLQLDGLMK